VSLAWRLKRLRSMGAREVLYRIGQFAHARAEQAGFGRARAGAPTASDSRPWADPLPCGFDQRPYRTAADAILQGRYSIFALEDAPLGFPPDWNRDPKTGTRAPSSFGKTINYRDPHLVGNIKYLWEPNRHLELVTLAQAWHLSREPRYARGCQVLVESWLEACPYLMGPNWTSSLELGIRLVNWSCAWQLLGGEASPLFATDEGQRFRRRWLDAVYQHCHFITGHLSQHSSANNHLLGEHLGVLVASVTWPCWPEATEWRALSHRAFEREALLQNGADGVNREQGIWYHHEVADMMLIAGLVGRANGLEFSKDYWQRLERMLEFIASIMDVGGHVPAWGDADDAVMVRFDPRRAFDAYRSLLVTGAVLFKRAEFKAKAQIFDDKSRWLLGDDAAAAFETLPTNACGLPVRRAFPEGGYYILGSDFETAREVRIVADAGPLGYLAIAAHGHADALSFTLSAGGHELLVDPGTYAYHTEPQWRDYFRGTAAHNTLRIDGRDQSTSGGNFLWTRHAQATCHQFSADGDRQVFVASHDGYLTLPAPAEHRRTLTYDAATRVLLVDDEVTGEGERLIELHWHFAPECDVQCHEDHLLADNGGACLKLSWPSDFQLQLSHGEQDPPQGWVSRRFDARQACSVLKLRRTAIGNWRGRTRIVIDPACSGQAHKNISASRGQACES
jgi:hypothetical protein